MSTLHLVVPGQVIASTAASNSEEGGNSEESFLRGHGTYLEHNVPNPTTGQLEQRLIASVVGMVQRVNQLITVVPCASSASTVKLVNEKNLKGCAPMSFFLQKGFVSFSVPCSFVSSLGSPILPCRTLHSFPGFYMCHQIAHAHYFPVVGAKKTETYFRCQSKVWKEKTKKKAETLNNLSHSCRALGKRGKIGNYHVWKPLAHTFRLVHIT